MRIVYFFLPLFLLACQSLHFHSASQAIDGDNVYIRQVKLADEQPLICYSEIKGDALTGVSCQNAMGVGIFAAGIKDNTLQLQKTTPFFSRHKVQSVVDALTLTLFQKTPALSQYRVSQNGKTRVIKKDGQVLAEVSQ